uniref:Centrosomal protein 95 n=1 Tax=Scophthalmus maximus TaxID=52904 RepID=A0A8D3B6V9_SCOMX
MGTQEGERDWVDVANDLFTKCHMNLRLRHLTDCDANVFSALYENIFGEKVPDYIAAPCSQEDDIHNIQSVIDSLSLDYLQISLSHITGENVVRGDKESIKNLLEIFDGLLEYLNEEISGDSLNGGRQINFSLSPCQLKRLGHIFIHSFHVTGTPTNGGPRRVLFRTQPDVLFLTLQEETAPTTPSPPDTEEQDQDEEDLSYIPRLQGRRIYQRERTDLSHRLQEGFEEPLSYRRQRNRKAEEELHHISENLSYRLEELDEVCLMCLVASHLGLNNHRKMYYFANKQQRATIRCSCCPIIPLIFCVMSTLSPVKVKENELLPVLLEELPHLHVSPHALGRMWEQQMQQVDRLHAMSSSHSHQRRSKLSGKVEEAQRKHDLLVDIVRKDQDHSRRLRDFKERIQQQKSTQSRLREQRQQIARAKKYHNDYHVQHRARLMRARTKEERMFRNMFEEGLELQKVRLREQRAYVKEQRLEHQRQHQDHIKSMENYYKDQFSLLAEKLAEERQDILVRKNAQEKALLKMKRELRSKMEREIGELQKIIIQNNEDDFIQDLEVQRLRNRVHVASFQHNTSYLH